MQHKLLYSDPSINLVYILQMQGLTDFFNRYRILNFSVRHISYCLILGVIISGNAVMSNLDV